MEMLTNVTREWDDAVACSRDFNISNFLHFVTIILVSPCDISEELNQQPMLESAGYAFNIAKLGCFHEYVQRNRIAFLNRIYYLGLKPSTG